MTTNKRIAITKGLYPLVAGSFMDFFTWGLLQPYIRREDNSFLRSCYNALYRSFPLQVANLFDDTKGACSITKYVNEIKKSSQQNDKKICTQITEMLNQNNDKLKRLKNKRGNDLAHSNLEIILDILENKSKEKRSDQANKSSITGKEIIECLLLAEKIYEIIARHELGAYSSIKSIIHKNIEADFKKIFGKNDSASKE